jgi:hypothetical protein
VFLPKSNGGAHFICGSQPHKECTKHVPHKHLFHFDNVVASRDWVKPKCTLAVIDKFRVQDLLQVVTIPLHGVHGLGNGRVRNCAVNPGINRAPPQLQHILL